MISRASAEKETLNKVIITLGGAELSDADKRAIDEAAGQEAASD